jgi:hypothetical protein
VSPQDRDKRCTGGRHSTAYRSHSTGSNSNNLRSSNSTGSSHSTDSSSRRPRSTERHRRLAACLRRRAAWVECLLHRAVWVVVLELATPRWTRDVGRSFSTRRERSLSLRVRCLLRHRRRQRAHLRCPCPCQCKGHRELQGQLEAWGATAWRHRPPCPGLLGPILLRPSLRPLPCPPTLGRCTARRHRSPW